MTDGEKISQYMQDATSNLRSVGRNAIYAIIATAWALSFTNEQFSPKPNILWALFFAILYVAIDFLYYCISGFGYKYLLTKYFEPKSDKEIKYKDNNNENRKKVTEISKTLMNIGVFFVVLLCLFLLLSSVFMVLALLSSMHVSKQ